MEVFLAKAVQMAIAIAIGAMPQPADQADEYEEYVDSYEYYEEQSYYGGGYDHEFMAQGVIEGEDGTEYTWYSQRVLSGGGLTELNENGRAVDDEGFVVDGDGFIAVASSDYDIGTVVDTPFGPGKVYDSGCDSGVIDIYTDW